MIDLKYIRERSDEVKTALNKLHAEAPIDEILSVDLSRREILQELEALRHKRKSTSKQIEKMKDQAEMQSLLCVDGGGCSPSKGTHPWEKAREPRCLRRGGMNRRAQHMAAVNRGWLFHWNLPWTNRGGQAREIKLKSFHFEAPGRFTGCSISTSTSVDILKCTSGHLV